MRIVGALAIGRIHALKRCNAQDLNFQRLQAIGFDVVASNGGQFETFLADEIARWRAVVETGKISVD